MRTLLRLSQRDYKSLRGSSKSNRKSEIGKSDDDSEKKKTSNSKNPEDLISVLPIAPSNVAIVPERVHKIVTQNRQKRDNGEINEIHVARERMAEYTTMKNHYENNEADAVVNYDLVAITGLVQNRRRFCGSITSVGNFAG